MNFGQAIEAIKAGKRVARTGWDKSNTWLFLVPSQSVLMLATGAQPMAAWIAMKTADGPIVPWVASHYDMLSENWVVLI